MKNKGITPRQLYDETYRRAATDPAWDERDLEYIDCAIDSTHSVMPIKTHAFDVVSITQYGGSEGIRSDIYVLGDVFSDRPRGFHLAAIKTLNKNKDAFMDMARLGDLFCYHAMEYAEEHLDGFR